MSEVKYKEEWVVGKLIPDKRVSGLGYRQYVYLKDSQSIAIVHGKTIKEANDRAKLIAAAPELLETLQKVFRAATKVCTAEMIDLDNSLCEAIDVIEKATT